MKTTKPIATISFNSEAFLRVKLQELLSAGLVTFWCYVCHIPEDDEAGLKNHIHLYIEPSRLIQTDDLRDLFKEYDPTHPDKPLGCLAFRSSVFGHWYLYGLHDKAYLASKGQSRRFHYKPSDFVASDFDELQYLSRTIDYAAISPYGDMAEAIVNGVSWDEYALRCRIPIMQLSHWNTAWGMLSGAMQEGYTFRGVGRKSPLLDVVDDVSE